MDYEQIYYVTDDGRNARAPVVIERTTRARPTSVVSAAPPPPALAAFAPTTMQYRYPPPGVYPQPMVPQNWIGYPTQPVYAAPPVVAPASNLASILGGFGDVGTLANILGQVFAALLPLPTAPEPVDSRGTETDPAVDAAINTINLIKYQNALALFAKRDQQILTIGSVLKELFKRPPVVMG
jgi:hypothetical protein